MKIREGAFREVGLRVASARTRALAAALGETAAAERGAEPGPDVPAKPEPEPNVPAEPVVQEDTTAETEEGDDPSCPDLCVPVGAVGLNCDYVYAQGLSHITVYDPDPQGFDGSPGPAFSGDLGIGCERP